MTSIENIKFDLPFEVPAIKKEYLPIAYVVVGVGVLAIVKNPRTVLSLVSTYFTLRSLVAEGKKYLPEG